MKQKVLLIVLALGMYSMCANAQTKKPVKRTTTSVPKNTREYQVGTDGFEWYKVTRTVNGQKKVGAEDRNGNMIVPTEYDGMWYSSDDNPLLTGFRTEKGKFMAWYSKRGKCVIPYTRGYTWIQKWESDEFGTYYSFEKPDGGGICDSNGREVVSVKTDGTCWVFLSSTIINGKEHYYLSFKCNKGDGFADANGRIIVPAEHIEYSTDLERVKLELAKLKLAKSRLTTTNNPLAGNRHEKLAEAEGRTQGGQDNPVAGQQQQSGGTTTPVVVEQPIRQPVPVQEWVACTRCGGSGICSNCSGSGTVFIGDNLKGCFSCGRSGKCGSCAGKGGQYFTVYK